MVLEVKPPFVDSQTIDSAGTPEALTTREVACTSVSLKAHPDNTGAIYVCDTATPTKVYPLDPGESIVYPNSKPRDILVDAETSSNVVYWTAS